MNPPGQRPAASVTVSSCALSLLLASACNLRNPGVDPPEGALAYPIALTYRDPSATTHDVLYVANSNFDLAYNAGSVQAYDLAAMEKAITRFGCRQIGVPEQGLGALPDASYPPMDAGALEPDDDDAGRPLAEGIPLPGDYERASIYGTLRGMLCDGRDPEGAECCFDDSTTFLLGGSAERSEVLIDSYAAGIAVSPDGKRLYVPVRSRDRLVYLDIDDAGHIRCGKDTGRCTRGTDASDPDLDPGEKLAPQPTTVVSGKLDALIAGGPDTTFVATAHETGQVSLFVDEGKGPVLHSSVPLQTQDVRLRSLTLDPRAHLLYVTNARSDRLGRIGARKLDDRFVLFEAPSIVITSVAGAGDTRDVELDLQDPTRLYVLMRNLVRSVLFLRLDPTVTAGARLESEVRVGLGPSRVTQLATGGRRLLLVSCFDARAIYVVDEDSRNLVGVIHGLSGPFEMLVDQAREVLYVADFSANVLRVIDIAGLSDPRLPPPRIIATFGKVDVRKGLM
jgi:DNA-binding beta-propeller fold protein YncE